MERTDEDRASGILRLRFGSEEREVPTLPLRQAREWQRRVAALSGGLGLPPIELWAESDVGRFANLTVDALLELAVAYDGTGALGGREWLEAHADPTQLYVAVTAMAENAFPFAVDGRRLIMSMVVGAALAPSAPVSSTSSPSTSGDSTPDDSRTASTGSS